MEVYVISDEQGAETAVAALFVVYFDVRRDSLGITGHAFRLKTRPEISCQPHADWNSLAIHEDKNDQDGFSLSYLHDGRLIGDKRDDVPGTTLIRLPRYSTRRALSGYFSDFVEVVRSLDSDPSGTRPFFGVTYFEVIRLSNDMKKQFSKALNGWLSRLRFRLVLSAGNVDAYSMLVRVQGPAIIANLEIEGGPVLRKVRELLKVPND